MNNQSGDANIAGSGAYLSKPWLFAFVAALCVVPVFAGGVSEEVGGWVGWLMFLVSWVVMFCVAWIVTRKYANPIIPTVCGIMIGMTMPIPFSNEWLRQAAGDGIGKAIGMGIAIVGVCIGLAIFNAAAMRHRGSSHGVTPL